ncbi:MAG: alkaline phosphatase family protein [Planctomycetes bacterium]|nr:alkaline phosphatase family protein [Planctomycetota bacterium]
MKKQIVIVLDIVGLSPALLKKKSLIPNITRLKASGTYRAMIPSFPAVTCSVQATLLSGKPPADHGIVGNGYFDSGTMKPEFWRQENALVNGPRIWDIMRERNKASKVAVLFWQNSKYINADIVVTPSPIHTDKGMTEWCYSKPDGYYEKLTAKIGPFSLRDYWGPMANAKSSQWIAEASLRTLKEEAPDMLLAYIPHLDYVSQRHAPDSAAVEKELKVADDIAGRFMEFREAYGKENAVLFIISEYGLVPVSGAVFPNRILRKAGLLKTREISGAEYIDFEGSDAFAVVDHQIAHIYCKPDAIEKAKKALESAEGVDKVLDRNGQKGLQIHNPRSGQLIALSKKDKWFAYYYWEDDARTPLYARTVDIHNKPGYDPCELFVDMKTMSIPLSPELIKGSHGLPTENDNQFAVMIASEKGLDDYAPKPFNATQFLGMLYRVI